MNKKENVIQSCKFFLNLFTFFTVLFLLSFMQKGIAYAGAQYSGSQVISNPAQAVQCTENVCPHNAGDFCWNSESPGVSTCGAPCSDINGSFGAAWSKYSFSKCYQVSPETAFEEEDCRSGFQYSSVVYSTADKCVQSDGASYLRSGYCSGATGGIYKTCCNNSGGGMANQVCSQVTPSSGAPGLDGVCPSGSHSVTCGYAGAEKPTCGPSACGDVPTATPTPSPSPTPTTNLCYSGDPCTAGQVNSSVCSGTGVSKTCYNFGGTYCWWPTTCQSGTACYAGVCRVGCAEGATQSICIEGTSCNL